MGNTTEEIFDYTGMSASRIQEITAGSVAEAELLQSRILDAKSPRTYQNTLAPLEEIGELFSRAFGEAGFMGYVHTDPEARAAGRASAEQLSKWQTELAFHPGLYQAVNEFSTTEEAADLSGERARLLEFVRRDLKKAGHHLPAESQARVKELTQRLIELGVAFSQNIAEYDDALEVSGGDLNGLPASYIDSLPPGEGEGRLRVTMAYPHVVPFMENADRRDLRQALMEKFNNRAVESNRPILEEAIALRMEIASLFDEPSWAHHRLSERMAKKPEAVEAFYELLLDPLTSAGLREVERITEMLEADGEEGPTQVWDWRYYDNQIRRTEYGVDQMEVAGYFPLFQVVEGMLDLTGEVFGLEYQKVEAPVWHEDVTTYAVFDRDSGERIAHFHMDLFPREGKFSHAAAFPLVGGRLLADGSYQLPRSCIVANFTPPLLETPALLQHSEVVTLFHEFGHILHQILTRAELGRFSGSSTEWDFVEAISQIMENWTWQPEVLARFAFHHESGQPLPTELLERLTGAQLLNIAISKLRQASFGLLDMALHGPDRDKDIDEILARTTKVSLFPRQEGTFSPASFGHLMGGYDAGYYGYLWSEVFGDDMWRRFEEEGITNPGVGMDYRLEVLEVGGSRDAIDTLRAFLGREPDNSAFLRKLGISR
ncbi:MAG: Zn-dependent oligopeptidase [Actinomycetia bacterium]|nr:Zn-dependent oligopeptidase [Actinomycetes bacterium]